MSKLCDECETVAHCLKQGCIPKQPWPFPPPGGPVPWTPQQESEYQRQQRSKLPEAPF